MVVKTTGTTTVLHLNANGHIEEEDENNEEDNENNETIFFSIRPTAPLGIIDAHLLRISGAVT